MISLYSMKSMKAMKKRRWLGLMKTPQDKHAVAHFMGL